MNANGKENRIKERREICVWRMSQRRLVLPSTGFEQRTDCFFFCFCCIVVVVWMVLLDARCSWPISDWLELNPYRRKPIPTKWWLYGTGRPTSCSDPPNTRRPSICGTLLLLLLLIFSSPSSSSCRRPWSAWLLMTRRLAASSPWSFCRRRRRRFLRPSADPFRSAFGVSSLLKSRPAPF